MENSKIIISEKDSKIEDSERTEKNQSGLNCKKIENILKTSESIMSKKQKTLNSKFSQISEKSFAAEIGAKNKNSLKRNKSPKLFQKKREREINDFKGISFTNMISDQNYIF